MNDDTAALLDVLAMVPADSSLEPGWEPSSKDGFIYRGNGRQIEDTRIASSLERLAGEGYVERIFIERLSLCPSCGSHALNVHEACLTCGSSNLEQFKALFHFRCGFVGPVTAFREERDGLRCPKCNRILADLGTDHDSPGDYFHCLKCTAMFQSPDVGARCLSCGARFSGNAMQSIGRRDVFAYRLTALGRSALRDNRLGDAMQARALAE